MVSSHKKAALYAEEPSYFEPLYESEPLVMVQRIEQHKDSDAFGYTEIRDTIVNDIPIRMYIPHHAEMTLHLGRISRQDTTIIYAAQAADVRADNGGIVGAFVLNGEPKASLTSLVKMQLRRSPSYAKEHHLYCLERRR